MNQNVEEIREHCKTKTENEARKEACEEVDDGEYEKLEEAGGRGRVWREEDIAEARSSTIERTRKELNMR